MCALVQDRFSPYVRLHLEWFLLKISLVCFGVSEARQAISGDAHLAWRLDVITLARWTANKEFEQLVLSIIRNFPLRQPSVLTARGPRPILQVSGGITAHFPDVEQRCDQSN